MTLTVVPSAAAFYYQAGRRLTNEQRLSLRLRALSNYWNSTKLFAG